MVLFEYGLGFVIYVIKVKTKTTTKEVQLICQEEIQS